MELKKRGLLVTLASWFDAYAVDPAAAVADPRGIDWPRVLPFVALHLGCFAVLWVGVSLTAVLVALVLYVVRMFAITAFYHRYFSHTAFSTTRVAQFLFAVLAASSVQRGPLWWASHHRHHHARSDEPDDVHSARQHGFLWSHIGWFLTRGNFAPRTALVRDLERYPELRLLDRFDVLVPLLLALLLFAAGEVLAVTAPALETSGWQLLVWGFCISTVVLYHATFTINSLAHCWGRRRYATSDDSRNNAWLALLTLGEGWHNNHHHFPGAARQGFYWWEIDLTYYGLKLLAALGVIWNLRPVPARMLGARRVAGPAP
jgi:stearoyl-CoA desaturase (delta-9 desaturase)